jgi:hypothetical protein
MEEISEVVEKIVRGCSQCGVDAPDILAAFVARTVIPPSIRILTSIDRRCKVINGEIYQYQFF